MTSIFALRLFFLDKVKMYSNYIFCIIYIYVSYVHLINAYIVQTMLFIADNC